MADCGLEENGPLQERVWAGSRWREEEEVEADWLQKSPETSTANYITAEVLEEREGPGGGQSH